MTLMTTISGKTIDLAAIDTRLLCIKDMAYALSNIARFNGHAVRTVSVAEHSLMVCEIMERHLHVSSPAALLAGLMHDGHEYLTGDVTSPVKQLLGDAWKVFEKQIQRIVLGRFGLITAFAANEHLIAQADMFALTAEKEQLMHPGADQWPCQITHPAPDWLRYGGASQFTSEDWRQLFLDKHAELSYAIRQAA